MRAVSLHPDVIVVTSALLQVNCVIVRGGGRGEARGTGEDGGRLAPASWGESAGRVALAETFVIDSPVLPDELDALPALLEQAHFPAPSGLLATHGDWDHLLGRLAFPGLALGVAESTAERLAAKPGAAQRELRVFDEELQIERARPLALGTLQALAIPGRCEVGEIELELYRADGHTFDGMAVWIPWARVLVAGDYLSAIELPTLDDGRMIDAYLATLERLRPFAAACEHVVPGHGPILDGGAALAILEEDSVYLHGLREHGGTKVELPPGRRNATHRHAHAENTAAMSAVSTHTNP